MFEFDDSGYVKDDEKRSLAHRPHRQYVRGEAVFATWCRPRAYDAVYQGADDPDLRAAADQATLEAIVTSPPQDAAGGGSYCPRCAATWRMPARACRACAVLLTGLPTS